MKTYLVYILTHGGVNPRDVRCVGTVVATSNQAAWEEAERRYGRIVGTFEMLKVEEATTRLASPH